MDKIMERDDAKFEYEKAKNENIALGPVDGGELRQSTHSIIKE